MWWARQDSNLQPDRYERPALTIELQAPEAMRPVVRHPFTGRQSGVQCRRRDPKAGLRTGLAGIACNDIGLE